ncbi:phage protease [Pseudoalteromonas sp. DL2-H2.2]|uniref:phage protease n=1 Tax=Pseudoalteromonas sp. DL2-H2.2 TaxID=2908889 RepID=UPI001F21046D|nr:phage protease [Pseudoalteromonas sp. DL2-H2.2]MCF2910793.1 phage protease [Pseudoalteromonas sp. DL2-H2.2]
MHPKKTHAHNPGLLHTDVNSLAVLSASTEGNLGIAVCSLENITIDDQGRSPRVQLMPDGQFKAHDGRPEDVPTGYWLLDDIAFQTLMAFARQRKNDFHFDYEHQTLKTEDNGQPAPASGWFTATALEYVPGEGLYALDVQWTKRAADMLKGDEYRYVSPVFHYNKQTGRPVKLRHFALTNEPAVDGMDKVIALKAQSDTGVTPMNEAQKLLTALGITVADGDTITDAHYTQATTGVAALKTKAEQVDAVNTQLTKANEQVAALKAKPGGEVDLEKYVPIEVAQGYQQELAALRSQNDGLSVDQAIEEARKDGRIIAAEEDHLKALANQKGFAALKANLDARSPIAALTAQQTTQTKLSDGKQTGVAALTTEDKYAADQLGISYVDYAKLKDE